jgi:DNA (cytosine-5)-methyltransferase 1
MNNVDTTKIITHLSLCTGYEGVGLGLKRVLPNVREIAFCEIEAYAIFNLAKKIEQGWLNKAPIYTNLKTFPFRKFRGQVDILSGGFPCQPFSVAGHKKATEDPRHLFPYIEQGIRECQPKIVLLENVEGIITQKTKDGEPVLKYVLRSLEELGYRAEAGIFSASEVGLPHQRKRVYILGVSDTECSRMHRGGSCEECGTDEQFVQGNEGERHPIRSEVEGCDSPFTELVNTCSDERWDLCGQQSEQGQEKLSGTSHTSGGELGYTEHNGSHAEQKLRGSSSPSEHNTQGAEQAMQPKGASGSVNAEGVFRCKAVARANEEQHEWEEPRVVGDSEGTRLKSLSYRQTEVEPWGTGTRYARPFFDEVEAQSKLGRTIDGTTCRVDALRLSGNGIVPATCAKAFVTLFNRISE